MSIILWMKKQKIIKTMVIYNQHLILNTLKNKAVYIINELRGVNNLYLVIVIDMLNTKGGT